MNIGIPSPIGDIFSSLRRKYLLGMYKNRLTLIKDDFAKIFISSQILYEG